MTIPSISMTSMMPSVSNISKDIISQTDTDSDSVLSLEELGIDEELFNTIDSDADGLVSQDEIASAIENELSQFNGEIPNPEEFASLLSNLGLEMPEPPQKPEENTMSSEFASELMSAYDTDGDSLLTSEEVSLLTGDEFSALDSNGDGSISTEELSSAIDEIASGSTPPPAPPSGGGGGAPMGGGSSSSEEEEEYSAMDTNEDGVVSQEEREAYYGINQEDDTDTTANQNALENIKTLMDALKSNSDDSVDLNSFNGMLKLINAQNNNSEINTYLNKTTSSSSFSYV